MTRLAQRDQQVLTGLAASGALILRPHPARPDVLRLSMTTMEGEQPHWSYHLRSGKWQSPTGATGAGLYPLLRQLGISLSQIAAVA